MELCYFLVSVSQATRVRISFFSSTFLYSESLITFAFFVFFFTWVCIYFMESNINEEHVCSVFVTLLIFFRFSFSFTNIYQL